MFITSRDRQADRQTDSSEGGAVGGWEESASELTGSRMHLSTGFRCSLANCSSHQSPVTRVFPLGNTADNEDVLNLEHHKRPRTSHARRPRAAVMLMPLPFTCCSSTRLHVLLSALLLMTLLSPGKVVADYVGLQFTRLSGSSDRTLESVSWIHKPNTKSCSRIATREDRKEHSSAVSQTASAEVTFCFTLTVHVATPEQMEMEGLGYASICHYSYSAGQQRGISTKGVTWGTRSHGHFCRSRVSICFYPNETLVEGERSSHNCIGTEASSKLASGPLCVNDTDPEQENQGLAHIPGRDPRAEQQSRRTGAPTETASHQVRMLGGNPTLEQLSQAVWIHFLLMGVATDNIITPPGQGGALRLGWSTCFFPSGGSSSHSPPGCNASLPFPEGHEGLSSTAHLQGARAKCGDDEGDWGLALISLSLLPLHILGRMWVSATPGLGRRCYIPDTLWAGMMPSRLQAALAPPTPQFPGCSPGQVPMDCGGTPVVLLTYNSTPGAPLAWSLRAPCSHTSARHCPRGAFSAWDRGSAGHARGLGGDSHAPTTLLGTAFTAARPAGEHMCGETARNLSWNQAAGSLSLEIILPPGLCTPGCKVIGGMAYGF
ncbi:hypothetical protein Cadr_000026652 [Camelus dromedarius]|uniref:Uncharacterized protein n=1 Tax=Camelus dromedarius TaxID=9838 RepID=A0A5N4CFN4_CAMDR|nr:hypothetical protein Cadr_000026652 [Camelus dromedarius]